MDYLGEDAYPVPPPATEPSPNSTQQHALDPETTNVAPQTPSQPALQQYAPSPFTIDPNDPYNGMPPPPETVYPDLPTLMRATQDHGRRYGYACVTSSNNYKRGIAYVRCDRGGEYVNHWNVTPETRVRKNRTRRLVGCKWKARAKRTAEGGWQLTMMEDKHSGHGPSGDLSQHPSLRQIPDEAVDEAKGAFLEGRTPKEVLERLKAWNPAVTPQDVYNLKAKISRKDTAEAKGTPVRGARLRGVGGAVAHPMHGGTPQGMGDTNGHMVGGDGDGDGIDPALRTHDPNAAISATLTAAVARMQAMPVATEQGMMGDGEAKENCDCKCHECKCCGH